MNTKESTGMASITDIICARTDEEREAARDALARSNAEAPTDFDVLAGFIKDSTTLDGKPLGLNERGHVVTLNG